jgi:WD40 repeat protein
MPKPVTYLRRDVLEGFTVLPNKTVFSPDGKTLLASIGSPDNSLILWDVESGEIVRRFIGHADGVNDVVISPDGLVALSASNDQTIILWDMVTGQPIQQYMGHTKSIINVAFSYDGRKAVSTDGQIIIEWQIDSLQDMIDWVSSNRTVYPLNCIQREQYNIRPFCEENSVPVLQPSLTIAPTPFLRVEVLVDSANIRIAPQPSATIVTSLNQGAVVDILEITPYWYKISWGAGQEGWISRQLVQRQ